MTRGAADPIRRIKGCRTHFENPQRGRLVLPGDERYLLVQLSIGEARRLWADPSCGRRIMLNRPREKAAALAVILCALSAAADELPDFYEREFREFVTTAERLLETLGVCEADLRRLDRESPARSVPSCNRYEEKFESSFKPALADIEPVFESFKAKLFLISIRPFDGVKYSDAVEQHERAADLLELFRVRHKQVDILSRRIWNSDETPEASDDSSL